MLRTRCRCMLWPRSWGCAQVLHARALPEDSDCGNQGALSLMWGQELGAGHLKGESRPATDRQPLHPAPRLAPFPLCASVACLCPDVHSVTMHWPRRSPVPSCPPGLSPHGEHVVRLHACQNSCAPKITLPFHAIFPCPLPVRNPSPLDLPSFPAASPALPREGLRHSDPSQGQGGSGRRGGPECRFRRAN